MSREPKTLTLEEALPLMQDALTQRECEDVKLSVTPDGNWLLEYNQPEEMPDHLREMHERGIIRAVLTGRELSSSKWEVIAGHVLGVPVVARDEAAELRAALEALAGSYVANKAPHDNLWHMLVRTEVLERARAALAASEGSGEQ